LPKLITLEPPPCIWFMMKIQNTMMRANGRIRPSALPHHDGPGLVAEKATLE